MSNPAQGAVGAETKFKIGDRVQIACDPNDDNEPGQITSEQDGWFEVTWTQKDGATYGEGLFWWQPHELRLLPAVDAALATPRTDSDEGTAEDVRTILARLWCQAEGNDPDDTISDAGHTVLDGTLGGLDKKALVAITEVERAILKEACKPWAHYSGEPPDDGSPLSGVFVAGMVHTERLLAKLLDVTHYEGGDGSEDFDNDATQTLRNILAGAGLWDADENRPATPAPATPPGVPDSVRALSEAASQGEWYTESEKCDGSYGSGEDCGEGYLAYNILTDAERPHGNPGVIAETSNSTLGVIHEESDEDGHTAWDETARANTAFIVAAVNYVRTLIATHPAGQSTGQGADVAAYLRDLDRVVTTPPNDPRLDTRVGPAGPAAGLDGYGSQARPLSPAPDSPLTGPLGVEDADATVPPHIITIARAMADGRAPDWEKMRYGSCVPQQHSRSHWVRLAQDAYRAMIAALATTPEGRTDRG